MVIGLDYGYVETHALYRQCLCHALTRAGELGLPGVLLGFGASLEKRRVGARATPQCIYVQAEDHFGAEVVSHLSASGI
jgi:hypothetical protein